MKIEPCRRGVWSDAGSQCGSLHDEKRRGAQVGALSAFLVGAARLALGGAWYAVLLSISIGSAIARGEPFVAIPTHHSEAAVEMALEGSAEANRPLRMEIYLAPRHEAKLDRLLEDLQDPRSSRYHRWLSADEYNRSFGPTAHDVEAITRWLTAQGFIVTAARVDEGRIAFEGDVAAAESAFRVRIVGSRDGQYFGNIDDPMVPASLAPKISYIAGLHNMSATTMHTKITDPTNNHGVTGPHFGPPDIWTYYNEHPLLDSGKDGSGQCIAALEGSDVDQASLTNFNTVFGLPPFVAGQNYNVVYPDGPPGIAPPISGGVSEAYAEALVDIQYAHGLAPGAEIVLYAGNYPALRTQGLVNTLKAATADNRCGAITISWAQCGEPKSFFKMLDQSYKRGVAQGQTIFVATGDVGVGAPTLFNRRTGGCQFPSKPGIEENAGSPNVTAVGATEIRNAQYDVDGHETGVATPAEEVWFFDAGHVLKSASTGGVSTVFKKPKFQKSIKNVKFGKRGVPDFCLGGGFPAPAFWECLDLGYWQTGVSGDRDCLIGGGSSFDSPQAAGIIAIIIQILGRRVGNINPQLYAMALENLDSLGSIGIRDVTQGNNGNYPLPGYNATTGFDLASGWGSLDIATFVNAYVNHAAPVGGR